MLHAPGSHANTLCRQSFHGQLQQRTSPPRHCQCETDPTFVRITPHLQQDLLARALGAQLLDSPRQPRRHQDRGRRPWRCRQPSGRLLPRSRASVKHELDMLAGGCKNVGACHCILEILADHAHENIFRRAQVWQPTPHAGADLGLLRPLRSWLACWWPGIVGLRSHGRRTDLQRHHG